MSSPCFPPPHPHASILSNILCPFPLCHAYSSHQHSLEIQNTWVLIASRHLCSAQQVLALLQTITLPVRKQVQMEINVNVFYICIFILNMLGEWFSKCSPWNTSSNSTWKFTRSPIVDLLNQKPWSFGPAICVFISLLGDSYVCSSLRTTAAHSPPVYPHNIMQHLKNLSPKLPLLYCSCNTPNTACWSAISSVAIYSLSTIQFNNGLFGI